MAFRSPRHREGVHSSPRYRPHCKLNQVWGPHYEKDAQSSKQLKYDLRHVWERCWNFFSLLYLMYGRAWQYGSIHFLQPGLALPEPKQSYLLIFVPRQINWTS